MYTSAARGHRTTAYRMAGKMTALQGEAHFFEESMNPGKVKEYLGRPKVSERTSIPTTLAACT